MQNIYLLNIIKQNKNKFSSSEDSLVDYFLQLKNDELVNKTLADMANETDISQTTIYNFVKKLGFNGFQDFKIKLASNSIIPTQPERFVNYTEIDPSDSYIEVAKKTIHFNQQSLENLINFLDEKTLHRIVRLLEKSHDVYFFGQGGSSVIALDSYHKFLRTKLNCHYVSDYHIQLSICSKLSKKDGRASKKNGTKDGKKEKRQTVSYSSLCFGLNPSFPCLYRIPFRYPLSAKKESLNAE